MKLFTANASLMVKVWGDSARYNIIDALHIACAEAEKVDYFCSCDDRLLKRARITKSIVIKIVSPFELVEEITV